MCVCAVPHVHPRLAPGAGHEALLARHLHRPRAHEGHLGEVDRRERLQHLRRRGALQRQDAVVG